MNGTKLRGMLVRGRQYVIEDAKTQECILICQDESQAILGAVELICRRPERCVRVEARRLCWSNDVWFKRCAPVDALIGEPPVGVEIILTVRPTYVVMAGLHAHEGHADEAYAIERAGTIAAENPDWVVMVQERFLVWCSESRTDLKLGPIADQICRMQTLLRSAWIHLPPTPVGTMIKERIAQELGLDLPTSTVAAREPAYAD